MSNVLEKYSLENYSLEEIYVLKDIYNSLISDFNCEIVMVLNNHESAYSPNYFPFTGYIPVWENTLSSYQFYVNDEYEYMLLCPNGQRINLYSINKPNLTFKFDNIQTSYKLSYYHYQYYKEYHSKRLDTDFYLDVFDNLLLYGNLSGQQIIKACNLENLSTNIAKQSIARTMLNKCIYANGGL